MTSKALLTAVSATLLVCTSCGGSPSRVAVAYRRAAFRSDKAVSLRFLTPADSAATAADTSQTPPRFVLGQGMEMRLVDARPAFARIVIDSSRRLLVPAGDTAAVEVWMTGPQLRWVDSGFQDAVTSRLVRDDDSASIRAWLENAWVHAPMEAFADTIWLMRVGLHWRVWSGQAAVDELKKLGHIVDVFPFTPSTDSLPDLPSRMAAAAQVRHIIQSVPPALISKYDVDELKERIADLNTTADNLPYWRFKAEIVGTDAQVLSLRTFGSKDVKWRLATFVVRDSVRHLSEVFQELLVPGENYRLFIGAANPASGSLRPGPATVEVITLK